MPELTTPVKIPEIPASISYKTEILFMGSCFAEHIGNRMQELKFRTCLNPFGVIYNPLSMAKNLQHLIGKAEFTEADLSFRDELWFSYSHYTLFSDPDKNRCLENINSKFFLAKEAIRKAELLFITLGTSWVFRLKETGEVVNNCHKLPATRFERFFSDVDQSVEALSAVITDLQHINPDLKIIFSVSPVRHWKDGAIQNQRSKSALHLSIAELQSNFKGIHYFPAYEIFMDELRDYRFYAADKLHPSAAAQEYIWEIFQQSFLTDKTREIAGKVQKILNSVRHRPRFPATKSYKSFIEKTLDTIRKLRDEYPFLDFTAEEEELHIV